MGDISIQGWFYSKAKDKIEIAKMLGFEDISEALNKYARENLKALNNGIDTSYEETNNNDIITNPESED